MGKIISFANQKGGVGKTTTCVNTAAYLALLGYKTLLIDLDPQGNASSSYNIEKDKETLTIYDVFSKNKSVKDVIQKTEIDNLDIIPATVDLAGAEIELALMNLREKQLFNIINLIKQDYSFILIDCPPSLGLLTVNALTASDSVLIPIQCEFYALEGLTQLMNTIRLIKHHLNSTLDIEGVVMTMKDNRSNLTQEVSNEIKKFFGNRVFETTIPRNIRLAEAPSHGEPICTYDPSSKGATAYMLLAKELLARNSFAVETEEKRNIKRRK